MAGKAKVKTIARTRVKVSSGANVAVRVGSGGGGGASDSGVAGFVNSNGVTRAALDALYVRHIAPSGDTTGATDSSEIQEALDAGVAVHLYPDCTYWVKDVILRSNHQIHWHGAIMKLPAGANTDVFVTEGFSTHTGSLAALLTSGPRNVALHGPGIIDGNKANQTITGTTIASASNGATLPTGTITVASTSEFPSSGKFSVLSSTGMQTITYTGKTSTTFTGCTGGTGTLATSDPVHCKGYGIRAYWSKTTIGGAGSLQVRNCVADGLWSEWGAGTDAAVKADGGMESDINGAVTCGNGRNGFTMLGPHDSTLTKCITFGNGATGMLVSGGGTCYVSQFHAWGTPQTIGLDLYTESHFVGSVVEVTNMFGSFGIRVNGVVLSYKGRIFTPGGSTNSGGVGIYLRGNPSGCDIDTEITDCPQGALVVGSDGGANRIKVTAKQDRGPAIARFFTSVASGSNGVNVNTFAGSGTLTVADTTNFSTSGAVLVGTASGAQLVTYTGKTSTTLTGCASAGAGVMATGHRVTVVGTLSGGAANDAANVSASSDYEVAVGGGTTARGFSSNNLIRKTSGSIAPSATANTYGTPLTITAPGNRPGLSISHIGYFSSAGVSGETLTFQVTATYDDGTTASTTPLGGITTNGASGSVANSDFYGLMKDGRHIVSLAIAVRSTIAASAATVTATYAGKF